MPEDNSQEQDQLVVSDNYLFDLYIPAHKLMVSRAVKAMKSQLLVAGKYRAGNTKCDDVDELWRVPVFTVG
jgi:hypothetical protein